MNTTCPCPSNPNSPYAWDLPPSELHELLPYEKIYLNYIRKGISSVLLFSGLASFLFFYLVMFKTKGELKQYRPIFLLCSVTDVMFYLISSLTEMKCRAADGVFMLHFEGPIRYAPLKVQVLGLAIFITILGFAITILPAQFFYRYYTITRLFGMSKIKTILLFSSSYVISIPMGVMAYFAYAYSGTARPGFNYGRLWYPDHPLPIVIYADTRHPYLIAYFGIGVVIVTLSYQVVLFIGYKTITAFNEQTRKFSRKSQNTQNQLTLFLIIQSIIPLFVSSGPNIFLITISFFRMDPGILMTMIVDLMALIPVCNPVLSIIVITPYRRAIFRVLGKPQPSTTTITSMTVTSK